MRLRETMVVLFTMAFLVAGCSGTKLYGNKSCGEGKTAYVTANGVGAICLPEREVAYILCARELGLAGVSQSSTISGGVSLDFSGIEPEVSGAVTDSVVQYYASEGALVEARADAIRACLSMYNGVD